MNELLTLFLLTSLSFPACASSNCSIARTSGSQFHVDCSSSLGVHLSDFQTLPVTYFNLRNNSLNSSLQLSKWPDLQDVDLSRNDLGDVPDAVFDGLKELVKLNLSYCSLNKLSSVALKGQILVKLVDLSGNPQLPLSNDFLVVLNKSLSRGTQSLHLSNLNLTVLPQNVFNQSLNLSFLQISDNLLSELPTFPISLVQLDVSNNSFHVLSPEPFALSKHLVTLIAENNPNLIDVDEDTFRFMLNIADISLRGNKKLTFLPNDIFFHNSRLRRLSISGCGFKTLPFFLEPQLMNLVFLDLRENPWECDESMRWLTNLKASSVDLSDVRCSDGSQIADHFEAFHPRVLRTIAIITASMAISFIVTGFSLMLYVERQRRLRNPYWRLGKNKPMPSSVYVSTTVV